MSIASNLRISAALVLAAALATGAVAQGPQDASGAKAKPAAAGGILVGVVDVIKAVEQYPRYIKLRAELEESLNAYEQQLQAMSQRADELRGTIQVLEDGSPERVEKEFEYKMLLQTQDFRRKAFRDRMQIDDLRNTLAVYEDLDYAIAKIAADKGVALVLTKQDIVPSSQPIAELPAGEVQARVKAYDRRQVWFASKELDLTSDVIKFMMAPLPERSSRVPAKAAGAGNGDGKE